MMKTFKCCCERLREATSVILYKYSSDVLLSTDNRTSEELFCERRRARKSNPEAAFF
jgi:hypothetical protein